MNSLQLQYENQDLSVNAHAAKSREMAEVQSQIFLAKQFPRDEYQAEIKILNACKRKSLATTALYSYPRGSTTVTGPSIRLAETIARYWGNINFGIKELEQKNGESTVVAYAWDMESNTRQEKVFQVKHERYAKGKMNKLTDPRDIYELTANNGARRLRACILGVIPGDIIDNAVAQCYKTLESSYTEPLKDRVIAALRHFQTQYGITQEMVETKLGHNVESFTEHDFVTLSSINQSLKDGMAKREDFFKIVEKKESSKTSLEMQFEGGEQVETTPQAN
ncbi:hypothetical protein V7150_16245 [Neobacillus drentensis]|uniref:hypothetical protein n=1 Tax=Neobacillus drentensis TaxID=220684 RepID=UPI002FFE1D54